MKDFLKKENFDSCLVENNIYSNDEAIIGTWHGKPLYRKVVIVNNPISEGRYIGISHNIINVDTIFIKNAFITVADNATAVAPEYRADDTYTKLSVTKQYVQYNIQWVDVQKLTLILNYTKTTD